MSSEAPSATPALELRGLSKAFGSRKALDGLSLVLERGAFLSVFGPNGAGKTTLLRLLATLARPSSGTIRVLGYDLREQPDEVRERIGLVAHRSLLYPDLTAEENLRIIARLYGVIDPAQRVSEMLDAVGLSARRHDAVRSFSRGMTQRLAIARALIHDPQLVLLDEPYSGLDPRATQMLDELMAGIRADRSFVMVSHDLRKGYELGSQLLLLREGRLALYEGSNAISFDDFSARYHGLEGPRP
ncbi:MAG: ABC transporter ATP-binding protein [Coriobacteriales bacterium]|jgi:heme exporter protein A|nr:ABC transporter ATP-binding protein [Coriobacteriales bacterium]